MPIIATTLATQEDMDKGSKKKKAPPPGPPEAISYARRIPMPLGSISASR